MAYVERNTQGTPIFADWHIFVPNFEIRHFLEVVGINIFGLANVSNLAYFGISFNNQVLTYAKC